MTKAPFFTAYEPNSFILRVPRRFGPPLAAWWLVQVSEIGHRLCLRFENFEASQAFEEPEAAQYQLCLAPNKSASPGECFLWLWTAPARRPQP